MGPLMLDSTLLIETIQLNLSKKPAIHIESEEDFNSWTDSTLLKEVHSFFINALYHFQK